MRESYNNPLGGLGVTGEEDTLVAKFDDNRRSQQIIQDDLNMSMDRKKRLNTIAVDAVSQAVLEEQIRNRTNS